MNPMENKRGHVIVLTYPAQGHINPLLQFAKRLASKGLRATLATTPYTLNSINAPTVAIEPISDGYDHGGFKQAPNTEAYLESFKSVGSKTLTDLILKFNVSKSPVNCLVYDSLLPWALDVAKNLGIKAAEFLTNSASVCSIYWRIDRGLLSLPESGPVSVPGLPTLGVCDRPSFLVKHGGHGHSAYLAMIMEKFASLQKNDFVFINTFEELESELAKAMSGLWPVVMIGPSVPSAFLDQQIQGDKHYGASLWKPIGDKCSRWLETKLPKSVIYVSFGSMAEIPTKQVEEIAWGLKGSNKNFIWVVKESEQSKLPIEFLSSIDENLGLIVTWCDQLEVLAHQAVGCFVTHCGWNSTLEGLSLGVPMVAMPQWSDQPTNAKFLEDVWRVGVRARKESDEEIVGRKEVERCIREVMGGTRREEIERNAALWREFAKRAVSCGGSSDKNINEFVSSIASEMV